MSKILKIQKRHGFLLGFLNSFTAINSSRDHNLAIWMHMLWWQLLLCLRLLHLLLANGNFPFDVIVQLPSCCC
jgi:hypothetical protein